MVVRCPHIAVIDLTPMVYDQSTGRMTKGATVNKTISCRINPSSNAYIKAEDGSRIKFTYTILCDLFTESVPDGSSISLLGKTLKIIQLHKYQTHIKIWVG